MNLKFRGRVGNVIMEGGGLYENGNYYIINKSGRYLIEGKGICQSTGYYDNNDIEIFTGDIISMRVTFESIAYEIKEGIVVWDKISGRLMVKDIDNQVMIALVDMNYTDRYVKIIDNVLMRLIGGK